MYCIVDIETTGNGIVGNKITEIAIFKHDGEQVIDEYHSLVNPQCEIPYFITGLTGIDNQMVRKSPLISDIASDIHEFTQDQIFVAHSVNFDYNVIKHELKGLGQSYVRKKLCTVRLSRKLFPGFNSYSLGKLCSSLEIPLYDRHRARGDAQATVLLFEKILGSDSSEEVIKTFLNARSQEATLPPLLSREVYDELPSSPGIYYFKNASGEIIYVGKAKNIQKRVLGHFYDKSTKEVRMCRETAQIDHEESGSELLALLMETAAIKHHFPLYNSAQKGFLRQYALFSYEDRNGVKHLAYNSLKNVSSPLIIFTTTTDCRLFMEQICLEFDLCPKYCHLQENVPSCDHFRISCKGVCRDEELFAEYNLRVDQAVAFMKAGQENLLIRAKGRNFDEYGFALLSEGTFKGYGFVPAEVAVQNLDDLEPFLVAQRDTPEARRYMYSHAAKYPDTVVDLSLQSSETTGE
ncbi:MAG: GIY-YIG nuclease family protein [Bacteroidia bacterium]|nr:GIY-YIG nuclease family protein [Bacteroidia bacterium]